DPWPLFALRVAVTFAAGVPSYYLLETPIRKGVSLGLGPRMRPLAYGIATIAVVAAGFGLVGSNGQTLTFGDRTAAMPTVVEGGGLDVLVLTDANGAGIAREVRSR